MLNHNQARQLVQSQLDSRAPEMGCEAVIIDSATLERSFGWVFFYQSKQYVLGDHSWALAGNAPLIVNRHTGQIVATGTAHPVEDYVARYEASLASGGA